MVSNVVPLVLSGGAGTRLWPLSRTLRPKQLLSLVTHLTLLQETLRRTEGLGDLLRAPIIVCNEEHRFVVAEQLREIGIGPSTIVTEPAGRNTAPAVGVAANLLLEHQAASGTSGEGVDGLLLLVLPADHVIRDAGAFVDAVRVAARAAASGYLVTFGVVPDRPETGYGYLRCATSRDDRGWRPLERFVEKPDARTAQQYVESGEYFWNSGMFVFSARRYLEELERHAPEIAATCRRAAAGACRDEDFTRLGDEFLRCPSDSIDYAVMEKTGRAAVVPLDAGWSDIGSWSALHGVLDKDADGNVLRGDVLVDGCRNSYIASSGRLVAAIGIEDCVIVETADAVLVMPHSAAQDVKLIVEALKVRGHDGRRCT